MALSATLGNVVRIGPASEPILVKDGAGTPVDPGTITVTVHRPDGTATTPAAATKWTTLPAYPNGAFWFDYEPPFTAAMVGTHRVRIVTTVPDAAFEDFIYFRPSPFAP